MAKHFSKTILTKAALLLPIFGYASSPDGLLTESMFGAGVVSHTVEVPDAQSWGTSFQEDPAIGKQGSPRELQLLYEVTSSV